MGLLDCARNGEAARTTVVPNTLSCQMENEYKHAHSNWVANLRPEEKMDGNPVSLAKRRL